jgi:hypothetical protein
VESLDMAASDMPRPDAAHVHAHATVPITMGSG